MVSDSVTLSDEMEKIGQNALGGEDEETFKKLVAKDALRLRVLSTSVATRLRIAKTLKDLARGIAGGSFSGSGVGVEVVTGVEFEIGGGRSKRVDPMLVNAMHESNAMHERPLSVEEEKPLPVEEENGELPEEEVLDPVAQTLVLKAKEMMKSEK